jgi:HEPN domain-containing protein
MNEDNNGINVEKIVKHWMDTSEDDFRTMQALYSSGSYGWALFLGHISIEKLLKAVYVNKYGKHAPFIHNLYRLAELCNIEMTNEQSDWFDKISSFNINARYDDYKREFYSLCTPDFTKDWIEKIEILRSWIKQMF